MSEGPFFPRLEEAGERLGSRTRLTDPELRELLCHDCDFFGEDHEDDLECSCYRILRLLLQRGTLTPESLAQWVRSDNEPEAEE